MKKIEAIDEIAKLGKSFSFQQRPIPLPASHRAEWRMAYVCLTLYLCCRSSKGTLKKLHVLNWAGRTHVSRKLFLERLNSGSSLPVDLVVRFDPALNRAIDLAIGEKLLARDNKGALQLSEKGINWVEEIEKDNSCFVYEKHFLAAVGKQLSEKAVDELLKPNHLL